MRKVLFLAYHFPPIGGAGVQRAVKFARYLPAYGYQPVVVTGPGGAGDRWTPEDQTLADELPVGTEVHRVQGPEPPRSSGLRGRAERLLDLPSPFSRWWVDGAVAVGREAGSDVDLILGELVPYFTAEAAGMLARGLERPWIADLQDPWALDEMWVYPSGLHRRLDVRRMRRLLSSASGIIMNTPEAVLRVRRHLPELSETPIVSIPNGFDQSDFARSAPERVDGAFRIVHTGFLHTDLGMRHRKTRLLRTLLGGMPVRGVDFLTRSHVYLLEAVESLIEAEPELRSTIEVHLAGALTDADRQVAARSSVVRVHGYLSHRETVELLQSADLLFLPMHDLPPGIRAGLVPGKTYEYLASGRPILASVPEGDARDLLAEAGTAHLCRPSDTAAMAEIIQSQLRRWRAGAGSPSPRADVVSRYERRQQVRELAAFFDEILSSVRGDEAAPRVATAEQKA